jgi:hypothetical protein
MVWRWPLKRKGFRRHGGIEDEAISFRVVLEPVFVWRGVGEEWDV